jgi:hypothetical protein
MDPPRAPQAGDPYAPTTRCVPLDEPIPVALPSQCRRTETSCIIISTFPNFRLVVYAPTSLLVLAGCAHWAPRGHALSASCLLCRGVAVSQSFDKPPTQLSTGLPVSSLIPRQCLFPPFRPQHKMARNGDGDHVLASSPRPCHCYVCISSSY